jgi:hypothetical protein
MTRNWQSVAERARLSTWLPPQRDPVSPDWPAELDSVERLQYLDVQPVADFADYDRGRRWTDWLIFAASVIGTLITWACCVGGAVALGMLIRRVL